MTQAPASGSSQPGKNSGYEISRGGVDKRKAFQEEFDKLLMAEAEIEMHRRGSNTLDEADIGHAYRHLLASLRKDLLREVISDFLLFAGGAVFAAGTGMAIENRYGQWPIWLLGAGFIVVIASLVFRYYRFK